MSERLVVRARVEGRVQGVGFRAWTAAEARRLRLDGWVANRPDGSVEALFAGPAATVEEMLALLARGPAAASVDRIAREIAEDPGRRGFEIAR